MSPTHSPFVVMVNPLKIYEVLTDYQKIFLLLTWKRRVNILQECILVGCVLPALVAVSPACMHPCYACPHPPFARFIRTVCMRRIRWSCEGLTSVHNEYTGYTLKHLLLRHMYNLSLPKLCATLLVDPLLLALILERDWLASHCTVRCLI